MMEDKYTIWNGMHFTQIPRCGTMSTGLVSRKSDLLSTSKLMAVTPLLGVSCLVRADTRFRLSTRSERTAHLQIWKLFTADCATGVVISCLCEGPCTNSTTTLCDVACNNISLQQTNIATKSLELDIIVVGAGVCGLASAIALQRAGHRVRPGISVLLKHAIPG